MTFTLDDARRLADRAHQGQTDKAGLAYIHHPAAVSEALEPGTAGPVLDRVVSAAQ
jgi:(p)ppGpp synthase/HD superfamily hydrolase